jgi:hypothetical protein
VLYWELCLDLYLERNLGWLRERVDVWVVQQQVSEQLAQQLELEPGTSTGVGMTGTSTGVTRMDHFVSKIMRRSSGW